MTNCKLAPACREDIPAYMAILDGGREFQRQQGFVQWSDGYPDRGSVEEDVKTGRGYALLADGQIAAYLYIGFDGDPSYPKIKGAWHFDGPYAVVHRIAIGEKFRGCGLTAEVFRLVGEMALERGVEILRIDTGEQNLRMRHVLEKNGFSYCGTVIQSGGDRFAYDKKLR